jgi:sulfoxide reductase heme-binding subunit YedZ
MQLLREKLARALMALVFLLCVGPGAVVLWKGFHDRASANPVDVITGTTGKWTLTFLLLTLSITP